MKATTTAASTDYSSEYCSTDYSTTAENYITYSRGYDSSDYSKTSGSNIGFIGCIICFCFISFIGQMQLLLL